MSTLEKTETQDLTALAADEVITTALTRVVEVPAPGGAGSPVRIALITLDNGRDHTRPNTLGPGGLASLDAAISSALAASPDAIAVTGKPFVFAVGADLSQIGKLTDRDTALAIGEIATTNLLRRLPDMLQDPSNAVRLAAAEGVLLVERRRQPRMP